LAQRGSDHESVVLASAKGWQWPLLQVDMRLQSLSAVFSMFEGKSKAQAEEASALDAADSSGGLKSPTCNKEQSEVESSPLTGAQLTEVMDDVSRRVKDWEQGGFTLVKQLQEAVRNHGRVELMRSPASEGSKLVAVKRMPTKWVRNSPSEFAEYYPAASERPWYDIGIVRKLNLVGFPYACTLMGVFRDQDTTFVASSLATEGDLFGWCDRDPPPGLAREEIMQPLVGQMFSAVRWLHNLGIAHRDLSLENILLTDTGSDGLQVKVIDFGMASLTQKVRREVRGKQSYQAPEMHMEPEYDTFLADIFALGVVLFAMAAQDYPWTSTKRNACQLYEYVSLFGFRKFLEKRRLRKGNGEHLIEVFSPAFVDLLDGLLEVDAKERLTLGEVCFGKERKSVWNMKWTEGFVEPARSKDGLDRLVGA